MSKKILITGKNSYVGTSFIKWMAEHEPNTECVEISVRGNEWKDYDFSPFDSVLHVAGIAHVNSKKFTDEDYYKVNTDLTVAVAEKAKKDGVSQFVFMSSIIVYNDSKIVDGLITKDTIPFSKNAYGDSKIRAEKGITTLENKSFKISIIRPPMIYGPGSKGNYLRLSKLAKVTPIFPEYPNKRSMIFIDFLCSNIYEIIRKGLKGVHFPQNKEYVNTSNMVKLISKSEGKRVVFFRFCNPVINVLRNVELVGKMFGDLYYDQSLSTSFDIKSLDFYKSIEITKKERK